MNKSKIIITINAKYGSPMQKKLFEDIIEEMIDNAIDYRNVQHKNNNITYEITKTF